jgi:hypothetical protein
MMKQQPPSPTDSDSNSDIDDEEAPLFFPSSNNFNSATTDPSSGMNLDGVAFGVNYEKSRRERKEKARQKQFEVFDIGDDDEPYSSYICSFRCLPNSVIFIVVFSCTIIEILLRQKVTLTNQQKNTQIHHGSVPSSRWGHRFDDDDDSPEKEGARKELTPLYNSGYKGTTHIPKYHSHGHANKPQKKKLTPHDLELDEEEWEEYEMEVGHLLSSTGPDWDIYQDPKTAEQPKKASDLDGYDEHWIQYFDQESEQFYYFGVETNITQWDKPDVNGRVIIFRYNYETGELEQEEPVNP